MIWLYRFPLLPLLGLLVMALCSQTYGYSIPESDKVTVSKSPEEAVEEFYRWYLHGENNTLTTPEQRATFRKYVASRLRREVAAEREVNIFVAAQNIDPGWEKNISVSKTLVRQQRAIVIVTLTGDPREGLPRWVEKLRVRLVREGGMWKVDDVVLVHSSEENR